MSAELARTLQATADKAGATGVEQTLIALGGEITDGVVHSLCCMGLTACENATTYRGPEYTGRSDSIEELAEYCEAGQAMIEAAGIDAHEE